MDDCLFCKISRGELNTAFRHEDDQCVAFDDIHPKAPVHVLIVPKTHLASIAEMGEGDAQLVGHLHLVAKELAESLGIAENGYRLIFNTRADGGQEVSHLHLHLLGGQRLGGMV